MTTSPEFTERARKLMVLANQEAERCRHDMLAPEHVLLATLRDAEGAGAKALFALGIDLKSARAQVEGLFPPEETPLVGPLLPSRFMQEAIERATRDAALAGHTAIDAEDLLLGTLHDPQGDVALVLNLFNVRPDDVRRELAKAASRLDQDTASMLPWTVEADQMLALAEEKAVELGDNAVDCGHLVLALLSRDDSLLKRVLEKSNVKISAFSDGILAHLRSDQVRR